MIVSVSTQTTFELRLAGLENVTDIFEYAKKDADDFDALYAKYGSTMRKDLRPKFNASGAVTFDCVFSQLANLLTPVYFLAEILIKLIDEFKPSQIAVEVSHDKALRLILLALTKGRTNPSI